MRGVTFKDFDAAARTVSIPEVVAASAGVALVALGIADIFLTILHPDRDGPASVALNRSTWWLAVWVACRFPVSSREVVALAGAAMIALTIVLWMALQVVGFALLAWPFLDTGFSRAAEGPATFVDALYWSGVTFTTLGYGDISPVTSVWKLVALTEAVAGFALVGAAVTFLLSVFQGIEHRDKMALRIYSETRRTWDGTGFVLRVLEEEGPRGLLRHVETWADEMRNLHERLYRFQPLAFYVRTRSEKHEPERMLQAVADVALTARILAHAPNLHAIRPAADEVDIAYTEFAISAIRHHGPKKALAAIERPQPTAADREKVAAIWRVASQHLALDEPPWRDAADEREVLELAARLRTFLEEMDRITRWRTLPRAT